MSRVFVFDAYGTVFDVGSIEAKVEAVCPGRGPIVLQLWRLKQLEYSWLHTAMGEPFEDFWVVTRQALRFALASVGVELPAGAVEALAATYQTLRPYAEAGAALAALPGRRAILSNGSQWMLDELVGQSGIAEMFDAGVISVDAARAFKPHPRCYGLVESVLGVAREEVVFVSSNGFDVTGARRYGFTTVWVNRATPGVGAVDASQLYRLQRGRPEQLGQQPDFVCSSLAFSREVLVGVGAAG